MEMEKWQRGTHRANVKWLAVLDFKLGHGRGRRGRRSGDGSHGDGREVDVAAAAALPLDAFRVWVGLDEATGLSLRSHRAGVASRFAVGNRVLRSVAPVIRMCHRRSVSGVVLGMLGRCNTAVTGALIVAMVEWGGWNLGGKGVCLRFERCAGTLVMCEGDTRGKSPFLHPKEFKK